MLTDRLLKEMNQDSDTLLMIFTLFRHGERTPLIIAEHDPNKHLWPEGAGALTKDGKLQAYEIGKKYRRLYSDFISSDYKVDEVHVYSTDSDRCLMTAQCCLAGLFPPTEQNQWHPSLNWQPIPIHTRREQDDPQSPYSHVVVQPDEMYNHAKEQHPDWYQNYINNKADWLAVQDFACKGEPPNIFKMIVVLDGVHLRVRKQIKCELPQVKSFPVAVKSMVEAVAIFTETQPYYVKQGCEMITMILDQMKGRINGSHQKKLFMYSLHDLNIWSVNGQLHLNLKQTGYCGTLTFELHKLKDEKHYLRLRYCQTYTSEPEDRFLDGNNVFCPIEKFEEFVTASQLRA